MTLPTRDRVILRGLAARVAEIAALPVMDERRQMWKRHNRLERIRPMVLIFPEGAWEELLPEDALTGTDPEARKIEWHLRHKIFWHEHLPDDWVFEPHWTVIKAFRISGWGVEPKKVDSPDRRGAWAFDPVLKEPEDLKKLRFPEVSHDEAETERSLALAHEIFDGILEVKLKGITHLSFHLMALLTKLRGLEQVMIDMCEDPGFVHEAMAFLEEGHRRMVQQYQDLNLLSLNNDDTYHSSGGVGYTDELPAPGYTPGHVRPEDMWASSEAQELAQVGPSMHEEFSMQYERRLLAPFGLNGYGCCEDLSGKLDDVLRIPNIRRISISPFANVERSAEKLGRRAIFSWKPHPSYLVGEFDEKAIRAYIRHALEVTRGCVIEMILKDTHTCEGQPERFTRWGRIAKELAEQY
jgi:hypothetical protein